MVHHYFTELPGLWLFAHPQSLHISVLQKHTSFSLLKRSQTNISNGLMSSRITRTNHQTRLTCHEEFFSAGPSLSHPSSCCYLFVRTLLLCLLLGSFLPPCPCCPHFIVPLPSALLFYAAAVWVCLELIWPSRNEKHGEGAAGWWMCVCARECARVCVCVCLCKDVDEVSPGS